MALAAELCAIETAERRGEVRRFLELRAGGQASKGAVDAVIRNLSENGLLLETAADLMLGERLNVSLPGAGMRAAIVMWSRPPFFGCEFSMPLTKGMVSEALLRAVPNPLRGRVDDGSRPTVSLKSDKSLTAEFDRSSLRVMAISLALLLWVVLVFVNIVMPVTIS
jgi:hypothetical protein